MFWYVYEHYDNAGKLFYVGKGKDKRAWTARGRSVEWQERASKGYSVHIRAAELEESNALHLEHELIKLHRPSLVNKLSGGGPLTPKKTVNYNLPKLKKKVAENVDEKMNAVIGMLTAQMRNRHNPKTAVKDAARALMKRTKDVSQHRLIQKATSQILRSFIHQGVKR